MHISWPWLLDIGFSEPRRIQKLLVGPHMVANYPKPLPLPHPSQYCFHVPFARQPSHTYFLNMLELH